MEWPKSVVVNLLLNIAVVAICPLLILAWIVRVRFIEHSQVRRRRTPADTGSETTAILIREHEHWAGLSGGVRR